MVMSGPAEPTTVVSLAHELKSSGGRSGAPPLLPL
jgi:hypothetical protein